MSLDMQDELLLLVASNSPMSRADLAEQFSGDYRQRKNTIYCLTQKGLLKRGVNGYELTVKGEGVAATISKEQALAQSALVALKPAISLRANLDPKPEKHNEKIALLDELIALLSGERSQVLRAIKQDLKGVGV